MVSVVDPKFEYLLSKPSAYVPGKEAEDLLFTDAFLQSMLKDATQDVTLANSAAANEKMRAGITKTNRPDPSTRVLRPIRSEAPGYFPEERRRSDKRKEHTTPANTWLRGGGRNVSFISCNTPKSGVNCKEGNVRVGEQILDFVIIWGKVTDDVWVDCVTSGVKFEFLEHPKQFRKPSPVPMSADMLKVCDLEVKELLKKRAVVDVTGTNSEGFVCALFVIPKKAGGFRPIVNLNR